MSFQTARWREEEDNLQGNQCRAQSSKAVEHISHYDKTIIQLLNVSRKDLRPQNVERIRGRRVEEGLGATYSHLLSLQYYRAYGMVPFRSRHPSSTTTSFTTYEREQQMARQLTLVVSDVENVFHLVNLHVM